ncbi:MAG: hypothetical protein AB1Z63_14340 [Candidatus Limnocylindrales bacterium]
MTDPARRAKPVGPPPPGGTQPPPPSGSRPPPPPGGQGPGSYGPPPGGPDVRIYRWDSSRGSFPWFAILLLVLGVGLLIEILIPDLSFGSLFILAAGLAFGAAWLWGGIVGATMPALVLTAWGLASVGRDFDVLTGDGWNTLLIGIAFLIGWGLGRFQRVRREYALWIGVILGVIGLADTSDALPFDLSFAVVIPLVMIGLGVYLVWQSRLWERR